MNPRAEVYARFAGESGQDAIDWTIEDADPTNPPVHPYADWAAECATSAAHWARLAIREGWQA